MQPFLLNQQWISFISVIKYNRKYKIENVFQLFYILYYCTLDPDATDYGALLQRLMDEMEQHRDETSTAK